MKTKVKRTKQSVKQDEVKILTSEINDFLNEVETKSRKEQLSEVETIKEISLTEIMELPLIERIKALKERSEANIVEAKLKPINTGLSFKPTEISGSDILGHSVYMNSIKEQFSNTVNLWRLCEKNRILEMPSFTRTWNTSLAKFEANKVSNFESIVGIGQDKKDLKTFYNSTQKNEVTRLVETIPYFDNINLRIKGLKGQTTTAKRFKYFFEHLLNDNGIVEQSLTIFIETSELDKNTDVGFNAMNNILVYNESETDKSIEILHAWLMYKGSSTEQLEAI